MSICAIVFVLFREPPTSARIGELEAIVANRTRSMIAAPDTQDYGHFRPLHDADLYASLDEDHSLSYLPWRRAAPLLGAPTLQDRLFVLDPQCRLWRDWYPDGPAADYVVTLLTLLAQPDIAGVWYGDEKYQDGVKMPAMTRASTLQLLDDFVRIGMRGED